MSGRRGRSPLQGAQRRGRELRQQVDALLADSKERGALDPAKRKYLFQSTAGFDVFTLCVLINNLVAVLCRSHSASVQFCQLYSLKLTINFFYPSTEPCFFFQNGVILKETYSTLRTRKRH
uniref:Uncharacterized protein n=1 Tax=Terrapene triunguis TaxID=2587831 RepID=A0A674J8U6_9SAUR